MKKLLAVLPIALALALSGCSVLGAAASMVPEVLGQSSAAETPFPSTVQGAMPSNEDMLSAGPSGEQESTEPSQDGSESAEPAPAGSTTELNPGDVIQTVEDHLPIGLQFLIDQIGALANLVTGESPATPAG